MGEWTKDQLDTQYAMRCLFGGLGVAVLGGILSSNGSDMGRAVLILGGLIALNGVFWLARLGFNRLMSRLENRPPE